MNLNAMEYRQKIQKFSKSTLQTMSTILFGVKSLQEVQNYHKIIIEAQTEQELVAKLKQEFPAKVIPET